MGNITCNICKTDAYKDYNTIWLIISQKTKFFNPVLTIHHLGKYNNYRICANCLGDKNMKISEKSSSIVLQDTNYISQKDHDKDDKIYWLII